MPEQNSYQYYFDRFKDFDVIALKREISDIEISMQQASGGRISNEGFRELNEAGVNLKYVVLKDLLEKMK